MLKSKLTTSAECRPIYKGLHSALIIQIIKKYVICHSKLCYFLHLYISFYKACHKLLTLAKNNIIN